MSENSRDGCFVLVFSHGEGWAWTRPFSFGLNSLTLSEFPLFTEFCKVCKG